MAFGFFDSLRKWVSKRSWSPTALVTYANYSTIAERQAMQLSVVYRCVDLISNSVAQLPLRIYDRDKRPVEGQLAYVINERPNNTINRFNFIRLMVSAMILRGNAFAVIERDGKGDVIALRWCDPDCVTIKVIIGEDDGLTRDVFYVINGKAYESINVLHLINYTYDGINGISTIWHACNSLQIATGSEESAKSFFTGGCNLGGVLTVNSMLNEEQKRKLKESWQSAFRPVTGTPQGVAVLEGSMQYTPITVKPADAQLLESRQYNVVDICRFFGVSPTKVFDLTKSSYSTIEAEALGFLSDTLQPILAKVECELCAKLLTAQQRQLYTITFDTTPLLRTDKASLASYFSTMFNIGALSQNEIRKQIDLPPIEGGDRHYRQVNLTDNRYEPDQQQQ